MMNNRGRDPGLAPAGAGGAGGGRRAGRGGRGGRAGRGHQQHHDSTNNKQPPEGEEVGNGRHPSSLSQVRRSASSLVNPNARTMKNYKKKTTTHPTHAFVPVLGYCISGTRGPNQPTCHDLDATQGITYYPNHHNCYNQSNVERNGAVIIIIVAPHHHHHCQHPLVILVG